MVMARRKQICPTVALRLYEGDEEVFQILQQLSLSSNFNDVIKRAIWYYGKHQGNIKNKRYIS